MEFSAVYEMISVGLFPSDLCGRTYHFPQLSLPDGSRNERSGTFEMERYLEGHSHSSLRAQINGTISICKSFSDNPGVPQHQKRDGIMRNLLGNSE